MNYDSLYSVSKAIAEKMGADGNKKYDSTYSVALEILNRMDSNASKLKSVNEFPTDNVKDGDVVYLKGNTDNADGFYVYSDGAWTLVSADETVLMVDALPDAGDSDKIYEYNDGFWITDGTKEKVEWGDTPYTFGDKAIGIEINNKNIPIVSQNTGYMYINGKIYTSETESFNAKISVSVTKGIMDINPPITITNTDTGTVYNNQGDIDFMGGDMTIGYEWLKITVKNFNGGQATVFTLENTYGIVINWYNFSDMVEDLPYIDNGFPSTKRISTVSNYKLIADHTDTSKFLVADSYENINGIWNFKNGLKENDKFLSEKYNPYNTTTARTHSAYNTYYIPDWNEKGQIIGSSTFYIGNLTLNGVRLGRYIYTGLGNVRDWYAPTTSGTSGQVLQSNGDKNAPTWTDLIKIQKITQDAYDALETKDSNVLYVITDETA